MTREEAPKILQPGKHALDEPPPLVAAKRSAILSLASTSRVMRRDHLDVALLEEARVESVAVVCLVADESWWKLVEEARI